MARHDDRQPISGHRRPRRTRPPGAAGCSRQIAICGDRAVRNPLGRTLDRRDKWRLGAQVDLDVVETYPLPGEISPQPVRHVGERMSIFNAAATQSCIQCRNRFLARPPWQCGRPDLPVTCSQPDPSPNRLKYRVAIHDTPPTQVIIRQLPRTRTPVLTFALWLLQPCPQTVILFTGWLA